VPFGIIDCDWMILAPSSWPLLLDDPHRLPFHGHTIPGAVLGEVFQHAPP
jgi:hypothetical protein